MQIWPALQAMHAVPPVPHRARLLWLPSMQTPETQQPVGHDVGSQVHVPSVFEQVWPIGQIDASPSARHVPPQSSPSPHAFPAQLGVQVHLPALQVNGSMQPDPAQQSWSAPPQGLPWQVTLQPPPSQSTQAAPPVPHCGSPPLTTHLLPAQHPCGQEVGSQMQMPPFTQRWPSGQVFDAPWQMPPQPSLAPHATPPSASAPQLGVHPQTPACPPPPHESGAAHAGPLVQHTCPLLPQPSSQMPLAGAGVHATPPVPHSLGPPTPVWHFPSAPQQPEQVAGPHLHTPPAQPRPAPQ